MTGQPWSLNPPPGPRGGPPWPPNTPGHLRVSQAEREAVAEQLRQHTSDGRLSLDEFSERLDACLKAKTYDELGQVLRDLPPQHPSPSPPQPLAPVQRGIPPHVLILGAALTAAVAAAVITGHVFPFVFLAVWCAVMVRRAYRHNWYSPPPPPSASRPPAPNGDWYHHYPPNSNYRRGPYHGGYDQQV